MKKLGLIMLALLLFTLPFALAEEKAPVTIQYYYSAQAGDPAALEQVLAPYGEAFSLQCEEVGEALPDELKSFGLRNEDGSFPLPQTLFFDENGALILREAGEITAWESFDAILQSLTAEGSSCFLRTVDDSGRAVAGVMIKLCDDSSCQVLTTGKDGFALIEADGKSFEAAVLKAPSGYSFDKGKAYPLNGENRGAVIVLTHED